MKLWIDDVRPAPDGYVWHKSVWLAEDFIRETCGHSGVCSLEEINLDHDAGDFYNCGGDYIEILKWLERECNPAIRKKSLVITDKTIFKLHSMNPVGVANMRTIIQRNGWKEIFY